MVFQVDPSQSSVDFTLGDVLHTVHGTFHMKSSTVRFDPTTGAASGELVVDATSGNSGSKGRDKKMHKDVLESGKYQEIRFHVQRFQGKLQENGTSELQLGGIMTLHGSDHPFTVSAPVKLDGARAAAAVHFEVPYVKWGLKNPSTFILRVNDKVDIVVHAIGSLSGAVISAR
jgi:polyisoprenoid-binding protein YceI